MSIKGHGASIIIEVSGYERPIAQNIDDANWLTCRVFVNLGYFSGEYPATFVTSDFVRFRNELKNVLSEMGGSASFETCEESLNCSIEMKKTGIAQIGGKVQIHGNVITALQFSFQSDQSFLTETLLQVEAIIRDYPVRT